MIIVYYISVIGVIGRSRHFHDFQTLSQFFSIRKLDLSLFYSTHVFVYKKIQLEIFEKSACDI